MGISTKRNFLINVAFIGVCFLLFYVFMKFLLPWLMPFIIAIILSALLQRPINYLSHKFNIGYKICACVLMGLMFFFLGSIIFILGYQIIDNVSSFVAKISINIDNQYLVNSNISKLDAVINALPEVISKPIFELRNLLSGDLRDILKNGVVYISSYLGKLVASFPSILVGFIITVVASFFFCMDYGFIKKFVKAQIPEKYIDHIYDMKIYMTNTLLKMFKSYFFIMCITFLELSIGMLILGIDFPFIVAAIICVVDILPVLGTGTVLIPWAIISIISGNLMFGLKVLIIYAVITIVRNIIEPKIVGQQIGLNPIVTLVVMYIGLKAFGILGVFTFPLLMIILIQFQKKGIIHIWNNI